MAIRDTWHRIVRKSVRSSSSSSSGGRSDEGHADPTTPATPTPTRVPTRPAFTSKTSWRSNHHHRNNSNNNNTTTTTTTSNHNSNLDKKENNTHHPSPPTSSKPLLMHRPLSFFRPNHPMYRQMTEQNLQYQEALSTYTMQFGRGTFRPGSPGAVSDDDLSDISPCHSRAEAPLDYGFGAGTSCGHDRRMSELGPMNEVR